MTWDEPQPWQAVGRRVRIPLASLRPDDWGVWLSREELLGLLRRIEPNPSEPPEITRLRAILGRLSDDRRLTAEDVAAARSALPAQAFDVKAASIQAASESLARANEDWKTEASWAGLSFRFLPISALP
jgi:hypothetical protein